MSYGLTSLKLYKYTHTYTYTHTHRENPFNVLCFQLSGICIKSELYLFR